MIYKVATIEIDADARRDIKDGLCDRFGFRRSEVRIRKGSGSQRGKALLAVDACRGDHDLQRDVCLWLADAGYCWGCDYRENSFRGDKPQHLWNGGVGLTVARLQSNGEAI